VPDLVTHVGAAYVLNRPWRWHQTRAAFLLGTVLPDAVTRPFYILFPQSYWFVNAWHTPVATLLFCLWIAAWFHPAERRMAFGALSLGAALHYLLDLLQRHALHGYFWLFPFSWKTTTWGLFWPEDAVRLAPFWVALVIVVKLLVRRLRRKHAVAGA